MAFLAPAAAAAGTTAATTALPGIVGGAVAPGAFGAGIGALGSGLATGAATTAGIFGTGLGTLGALGGLAPVATTAAGTGLGGLGAAGLSAAKTAGTTAALEGTKNAIISNAMQQQAMQNAIMQNAASGIASPVSQLVSGAVNPAAIQAQGIQNLARAKAAGMPIASPNNALLRASMASANTPTATSGILPESLLPSPNVAPAVTPTVTPQVSDLATQLQTAQLKGAGQAVLPADTAAMSGIQPGQNFLQNIGNFIQNPSMQGLKDYAEEHPYATSAMAGLGLHQLMKQKSAKAPEQSPGMIRPYTFDYNAQPGAYDVSPTADSSERLYFNPVFTAQTPYEAPGPEYKASGGLAAAYAVGGPVEQMAAMNSVGMNTGYPMAGINTPMYANPMIQRPEATNVIAPSADAGVGAYSGEPRFASGGMSHLGDYSDGGRLLKGPGDGVSDSIPASIGDRQPARLADGEFVVPARIVSEIGNGSTEAGARKLYAMMDRVQNARRRTTGKNKVAKDTKADKYLPA